MPRARTRRPPPPAATPPVNDPERTPAHIKQLRRSIQKRLVQWREYRAFKAEEAAKGFGVLDATGKWLPNDYGDAPPQPAERSRLYNPWADEDD